MKRFPVIFILIFTLFYSVQGEELPIESYGFKFGGVSSTLKFEYDAGFDLGNDQVYGFSAGIYYEWFDFKGFRLLTELSWVQKGSKESVPSYDEFGNYLGEEEFIHRLNYLSVPVLAKFYLPNKILEPFLTAGLRFDFFMSYDTELYTRLFNEFQGYVIGADLGLGFQKELMKDRCFIFEVRYSLDLTNSYSNDYLKIKNESTQFLIGVEI